MCSIIALVDKQAHELKRESGDQFVYQEHWLPSIMYLFQTEVRFCSIEKGVAATWEALGDQQQNSSFTGVIVSARTVDCDDEGDLYFGIMSSVPSPRHEQRNYVLTRSKAWAGRWGYWSQIIAWTSCNYSSAVCMTVWYWLSCTAWWRTSWLRQSRQQRSSMSWKHVCKQLMQTLNHGA